MKIIAWGLALVAVAAVIGFAAGRDDSSFARTLVRAAAATPGVSARASGGSVATTGGSSSLRAGQAVSEVLSNCAVAREQAAPVRNCGFVTLTPGHGIDLDSPANDWGAHDIRDDDLTFYGQQLDNSLPGRGLDQVPPDHLSYLACASSTRADFHDAATIDGSPTGASFLAITPTGRCAAIQLAEPWTPERIRLWVVTWETLPTP
jgi:hypothetical protein